MHHRYRSACLHYKPNDSSSKCRESDLTPEEFENLGPCMHPLQYKTQWNIHQWYNKQALQLVMCDNSTAAALNSIGNMSRQWGSKKFFHWTIFYFIF